MKRTITLLSLMMLAAFSGFAYVGGSQLHLGLFTDGDFTVSIEGQRFTNVRGNLVISDLNPGTHQIRIVENFYGRRGHRVESNLLYHGSINVPFRSAVYANLTNGNNLRIHEIVQLDRGRDNHQANRGGSNRPGTYRGHQNSDPYRGGVRGGNRHGYGNEMRRGQAAFQDLSLRMRNARFENDRLLIAKEYARNFPITSAQTADIMRMFSFESSRLHFARFAHRHVVDPQNYYIVYDAFSFSSSRHQLRRQLGGR